MNLVADRSNYSALGACKSSFNSLVTVVLTRQFTARFDWSEYRVFHAGILVSQVAVYKVCCRCV